MSSRYLLLELRHSVSRAPTACSVLTTDPSSIVSTNVNIPSLEVDERRGDGSVENYLWFLFGGGEVVEGGDCVNSLTGVAIAGLLGGAADNVKIAAVANSRMLLVDMEFEKLHERCMSLFVHCEIEESEKRSFTSIVVLRAEYKNKKLTNAGGGKLVVKLFEGITITDHTPDFPGND
ncbi:hypothetical protein L2E82_22176 [Cichorium intybus]|uniref:Uncharacterized protein n=1 Tax=Cichorium intybus TaxID=13427 RepID=A0ACB9DXE7_CICIN|nr:hypothetical protein L2E82_22176 [Cichorium intybus]